MPYFFARHCWMRLVESSNREVSGASEVHQSHGKLIFQKVQLLCFCSKLISLVKVRVDQNTIGAQSEH